MKPHLTITCATLVVSTANANITGFGDFDKYSINLGDTQSFPALDLDAGSIRITNDAFQSRSIFNLTRQDITNFTASFTYQAIGDITDPFGATFVVHNSSRGPDTVARYSASGVTTQFGYTEAFGPFGNSVAASLESGMLEPGSTSTGLYTNGQVGGASESMEPVDIASGNPINVTVTYNGTLLTTTFLDTVTNETDSFTTAIDIESFVGDTQAYVGFTASGGRNDNLEQYISNFRFAPIPTPGSLVVPAIAGAIAIRRRR